MLPLLLLHGENTHSLRSLIITLSTYRTTYEPDLDHYHVIYAPYGPDFDH